MQCSSWDNLFCLLWENQPVILLIAEIFKVHWITLYIRCTGTLGKRTAEINQDL